MRRRKGRVQRRQSPAESIQGAQGRNRVHPGLLPRKPIPEGDESTGLEDGQPMEPGLRSGKFMPCPTVLTAEMSQALRPLLLPNPAAVAAPTATLGTLVQVPQTVIEGQVGA